MTTLMLPWANLPGQPPRAQSPSRQPRVQRPPLQTADRRSLPPDQAPGSGRQQAQQMAQQRPSASAGRQTRLSARLPAQAPSLQQGRVPARAQRAAERSAAGGSRRALRTALLLSLVRGLQSWRQPGRSSCAAWGCQSPRPSPQPPRGRPPRAQQRPPIRDRSRLQRQRQPRHTSGWRPLCCLRLAASLQLGRCKAAAQHITSQPSLHRLVLHRSRFRAAREVSSLHACPCQHHPRSPLLGQRPAQQPLLQEPWCLHSQLPEQHQSRQMGLHKGVQRPRVVMSRGMSWSNCRPRRETSAWRQARQMQTRLVRRSLRFSRRTSAAWLQTVVMSLQSRLSL